MIRLEIKNFNIILQEKQQKYQTYHLEKLINMNMLQVKKYCLLVLQQEELLKIKGKRFKNKEKDIYKYLKIKERNK